MHLAPEASALSPELRGQKEVFHLYHKFSVEANCETMQDHSHSFISVLTG